MSEMVVRVARAMKPTTAKLVDRIISMGGAPEEAVNLLPLEEATRAIKEMMIPTDEMEDAGWEQIPNDPDDWSPVSAYQRMIEAALKSNP